MDDALETVRRKVDKIFRELVGDRASRLDGNTLAATTISVIADAFSEDYDPIEADRIGLNMADWNSDAAFIVALHLFPERFTPGEVRDGIGLFLCHAPNHIREACRLTKTYVWEDFPYDDEPPATQS